MRLLISVSLLALSVGCSHHRRAPHVVHDPIFGALSSKRPSRAALAEDVAYARAIASGENPPPPKEAQKTAGKRVFLTFFAPPSPPVVSTGLGADLAASIAQAAHDARAFIGASDVERARIELDVARAVGASSDVPPKMRRLGRVGVARVVDPKTNRFGFVLPNEIFTRRLLDEDEGPSLDRETLEALIEQRLTPPPPPEEKTDARFVPFETVSVVESHDRTQVLPLFRGLLPRLDPSRLDPERLRGAIRIAADYLARICGDDGKFAYVYDAVRDVDVNDDYSIIRHAGAADGLLEAFDELHDARYLAAAERALDHLATQFKDVDDFSYLPDDDNALAPIGGTGLSLIAFAKHREVTRGDEYLSRMRAMGRFLLRQQTGDGTFQPYFPADQPGLESREVLYYPGEAMLGLLRLYAVDRDERWLEAAKRAAHKRADEPRRGRDFWFVLACAELSRLTNDPLWFDRLAAITDATIDEQDDDERKLAETGGSFDEMLRASPTSTALEATAVSVALARHSKKDESRWMGAARRAATHILWQQLDEDAAYYVMNPKKALGGVRTNPWGSWIRIDNDQHAILGWLWLMRVMRDPNFGAQ